MWERITHEIIHIGLLICEHVPCIEILLMFVSFFLLISGLTMTGKNFLKSRKELVGNVTKPVCQRILHFIYSCKHFTDGI